MRKAFFLAVVMMIAVCVGSHVMAPRPAPATFHPAMPVPIEVQAMPADPVPVTAGPPIATASMGPRQSGPPVAPAPAQRSRRHLPDGCPAALATFLDADAEGRVTADLVERLPALTEPSHIAAVTAMLRDADEEDTVRNEAINLLRRSGCAALPEVLLSLLDQPGEQERFRSFVVQHLGVELAACSDPMLGSRLSGRLRLALQDAQPAVRREAFLALSQVQDAAVEDLLGADPSSPRHAGMRDLAIRLLVERDRREALPAVRALADDPDEATRIAAIHALGAWRDETSRPILEAARDAGQERTRRAATLALRALAGETTPFPLR